MTPDAQMGDGPDNQSDLNPLFEAVNDPAAEQPEAMEEVVELQASTAAEAGEPENEALQGSYTWQIKNWAAVSDQKLYSPKFEIGTYYWRLLVFPKGNRTSNQPDHLSVYLDAPEAPWTPPNLNPKASFKLTLINQNPQANFFKEATHTFSAGEVDWGFTTFISLDDVNDASKGFVVDDTVTLTVHITIQRDERYSYDSRRETGHVGLKNQGATCYMNSLLQYLYNIPYFRKAVYHMPTNENDDPTKSIPLALQSLFYKLQYSRTSVSTKDLTKSFGWGTYDAFTQHDVQELNRVLCEKLEEKMKGTTVEKVIIREFAALGCCCWCWSG